MTEYDKGHYTQKHPVDRVVDPVVAKAVKENQSNNEISCTTAFTISEDLGVTPDEVGFTIDKHEITIIKCQLGLYGYKPDKKIIKPADQVSPDLEDAIRAGLVNDRFPCVVAWETAEKFEIKKMEVSSACEALGIKITPCQLGAF
jgi:hypothetical protein